MSKEKPGEDGAADGVPRAGDGAGKHGERLLGGKESAGENGGQTSVLHTHFDADGAFLGCVETRQSASTIAEHIAQRVVAEHHGEGP